MNLLILTDALAALEASLVTNPKSLPSAARLDLLMALAWHLRQRDCGRALMLADEAEALLSVLSIDETERQRCLARLKLVRGEVCWLHIDYDGAQQAALEAMSVFENVGDRAGSGDAKLLMVSISNDKNPSQKPVWLQAAADDYAQTGDMQRISLARSRALNDLAFSDAKGTAVQLAEIQAADMDGSSGDAWFASASAIVAGHTGDSTNAIKFFIQTHKLAVETGQIGLAINTCGNLASSFTNLMALNTALEWAERATTDGRARDWKIFLCNGLRQTGNILRLLDRHADAKLLLAEALAATASIERSQMHALVFKALGELALDVNDPVLARNYFYEAEAIAKILEEPFLEISCLYGHANALSRLARPFEARDKLTQALEIATVKGARITDHIQILRIYAELYQQYSLPAPAGMSAPSVPLHYLNEALALAAKSKAYTVPAELLDEVANAYAAIGDFRAAFAHSQEATRARDHRDLEDARKRAVALRVSHETEQAHAAAEHHRQLAHDEAARATALQEASVTFETLGMIGREMTASLNIDNVFATLQRHINQLLDAPFFSVYLLDPTQRVLKGVLGVENGVPFALASMPVDDPVALSARCARERREVVVNVTSESPIEIMPPTKLDTVSLLFVPLLVGERLLGVMSIQSIKTDAYGERDYSVFRTLCSYVAIALDNAAAYAEADNARQQANQALGELREAEAVRISLETQLRESQKMQAIGTLAGGIAHDFNNILATIMGNVELARQDAGANTQVLESVNEIHKAGARAVNLVQQILSFSRRQPIERKWISLEPIIDEAVRLLRATLPARVVLETYFEHSLPEVFADATQIQQVVINLATNAMHAMRGGQGNINIRLENADLNDTVAEGQPALGAMLAQHRGKTIRLIVADNGSGMDTATLGRIFEPFFTTKPVDEGTGLGLSVVHGIAEGHEGAIVVESAPGRGSTFTLYLPVSTVAVNATAVTRKNTSVNGCELITGTDQKPVLPALTAPKIGPHILYLDDDESLVFLLKRLLERRGMRVSAFLDQNEALDALRADPDGFDLVVSDYNMPGMSGLDVAREVWAIRANLGFAIASGFIDEKLRAEAEAAGVLELIFKANAVEDLCEAIMRVLQTAAHRKYAPTAG